MSLVIGCRRSDAYDVRALIGRLSYSHCCRYIVERSTDDLTYVVTGQRISCNPTPLRQIYFPWKKVSKSRVSAGTRCGRNANDALQPAPLGELGFTRYPQIEFAGKNPNI
jgi:hypothetical protein